MAQRITFSTLDGVEIVGSWMTAPTQIGAALLVHMMPTTKDSWSALQISLMKRGIASLAIDLRGHGESTHLVNGGVLNWETFSNEDHQNSIYDLEASLEWMRVRGIERRRTVIIGASVGANLAVQALANEPMIGGVALLSPGESYHGLNAVADVEQMSPDQALFVSASEDDRLSFDASKKVFEISCSTQKVFQPFVRAGHGTQMFQADPKLIDMIADWARTVISGA